jgi:hypothetical protein
MHRKFSPTDPPPDDDKKRAQEEAQRENEARRHEALESRRGLCTFLKFWCVCTDRRCKRARQCAGDVEACFKLFWPHVPDDIKNEIRQAFKFMADGMPPRQAVIEAHEYVAQRKRIEQEMLAREAAQRTAPPEPEPAPVQIIRVRAPARHVGPRVRGM